MKDQRILVTGSKTHPDFTIRHGHLSRVTPEELDSLRAISDFCINQVNGGVRDLGVDKGSQYFIQDNTKDKTVRSVFESYDYTENESSVIKGLVSFSRRDLVEIYNTHKDIGK